MNWAKFVGECIYGVQDFLDCPQKRRETGGSGYYENLANQAMTNFNIIYTPASLARKLIRYKAQIGRQKRRLKGCVEIFISIYQIRHNHINMMILNKSCIYLIRIIETLPI
jgi:hypothetical protein